MKKIYIGLSCLVTSLIILFYIIIKAKIPKTFTIAVIPKSYNIVSLIEEEDFLFINVLVDTKKTFVNNLNNVTSAAITNEDGEQLSLKILEIEDLESEIKINNKIFYQYLYKFKIDFHSTNELAFELNNAYLSLNYTCDIMLEVNIGSFSYYKFLNLANEYLSISKLKSIVNNINGVKTLAAIDIGLRNTTNKMITIKNIIPLDGNIVFAFNESVPSTMLEYKTDILIDELLEYPYNFIGSVCGDFNYTLAPGDNKSFLFPLKYYKIYALNKLGFMIVFVINDEEYRLIYDDFTFFNTKELSKKVIDELILYTYENH